MVASPVSILRNNKSTENWQSGEMLKLQNRSGEATITVQAA